MPGAGAFHCRADSNQDVEMLRPSHVAAQELFNVLDLVAAAKAAAAAPTAEPEAHGAEADEDGGPGGDGSDDDGGEAEQAQELEPAAVDAAAGGLQTFVFSATLTLPLALRRRLQKRARSFVACMLSAG